MDLQLWSCLIPPRPLNCTRIVCMGDTNGCLPVIPYGDILIHTGNFLDESSSGISQFISKVDGLPHMYKVLGYGRNENTFARKILSFAPATIITLDGGVTTLVNKLRVYSIINNTANDQEVIPPHCYNDIIVSCIPPAGLIDGRPEIEIEKKLTDALIANPPRVLVFGGGPREFDWIKWNDIICVNARVLGDGSAVIGAPVVIDWPKQ